MTSTLAAGKSRVEGLLTFYILYTSIVSYNAIMGFQKNLTTGEGDSSRQIVYGALFLGVLLYSCAKERSIPKIFSFPIPWAILMVFCLASSTWALEPDISIRRSILLIMITWITFRCVVAGGYEGIRPVVRVVLLLTLIGNYLWVIFIPSIGIHQAKEIMDPSILGAWKGMVAQKNHAGAVTAMLIIFYFFDSKSIPAIRRYLILAFSIFFLIKTQSKTSMGVLTLSIIIAQIYKLYSPKYKYLVATLSIIPTLIIFYLVRMNWNLITNPVLDPYAFTGRGAIWAAVIDWLHEDNNWVLGSGFGSFWNIGNQSPIFSHGTGWITEIGNAHDGYLEVLSTLGVFGLALTIFTAFLYPILLLMSHPHVDREKGALVIAVIIFAIGQNFTESTLLDRDQFINVFIVLSSAFARDLTYGRPWEFNSPRLMDNKYTRRKHMAETQLRKFKSGSETS